MTASAIFQRGQSSLSQSSVILAPLDLELTVVRVNGNYFLCLYREKLFLAVFPWIRSESESLL